MGVVDVSSPVIHVKDLSRLSNRAEQRVVAPLTLLVPVIADRSPLGELPCRNH